MKTPKGIVKFPNITRPDAKEKYRLALSFDPNDEEFKKFEEEYKKEEQNFGKAFRGKPLAKPDKDKNDDGEYIENGRVIVNFTGSQYKPAIFDAKGNKADDIDIGWGTIAKVSFKCKEFDTDGNKGICKYISGIQVLELNSSGVTAESCGFEAEEGFVYKSKLDKSVMTEAEVDKAVEAGEIAWDS